MDQVKRRETVARPIRALPTIASMIRAVTMQQEPAPLIVGERVNTQGSRKVKRFALADDFDGLVNVALNQMEEGAHAIDVCMALTERADEAETMRKLVKKLSLNIEAPLVIDSTEAEVVRIALEAESGPGDRQLDQHGERPRADRSGHAPRRQARRRRDRPDHRPGRHGQNPRAQT